MALLLLAGLAGWAAQPPAEAPAMRAERLACEAAPGVPTCPPEPTPDAGLLLAAGGLGLLGIASLAAAALPRRRVPA
ncbi:hypothetical protein M0638_13840 [Roseomonas sp. NAR14]|uniref:Uncharacterized protein n=1 Tax=Roseomonas acroporae TaxID=2937791 RepID=A0A9X1Y9B6_9PROT|nr:hypothetical protein [Roseomonas acroporae]MCK8785467.1 hypothetical protein [Roseomonas acroporae]